MEQPGESGLETFLLDSAERGRRGWRRVPALLAALLALVLAFGWYWSREPAAPDPATLVAATGASGEGAATTLTLLAIAGTLLDKPGGYLGNDVLPPGVLMDDMPAFELGVLVHVRDMARALRRDFSRAPGWSVEDPDLVRAEAQFNFRHDSWIVPSSEGEYRLGLEALAGYRARLLDPAGRGAAFFAREDALARWLADVHARLEAHGQRLAAAAAPDAPVGTVDDGFHEVRGYCWALRAQLQATAIDFAAPLAAREARADLEAALRELDGALRPVRSPVILNGSEYGVLANHSLVLAGYVSRAGVAVSRLRARLGGG